MSNPNSDAATGFLLAGVALEVASVIVLWQLTSAWSDIAFIVLFCAAWALIFMAGATWIDGHFAAKRARDKAIRTEGER